MPSLWCTCTVVYLGCCCGFHFGYSGCVLICSWINSHNKCSIYACLLENCSAQQTVWAVWQSSERQCFFGGFFSMGFVDKKKIQSNSKSYPLKGLLGFQRNLSFHSQANLANTWLYCWVMSVVSIDHRCRQLRCRANTFYPGFNTKTSVLARGAWHWYRLIKALKKWNTLAHLVEQTHSTDSPGAL